MRLIAFPSTLFDVIDADQDVVKIDARLLPLDGMDGEEQFSAALLVRLEDPSGSAPKISSGGDTKTIELGTEYRGVFEKTGDDDDRKILASFKAERGCIYEIQTSHLSDDVDTILLLLGKDAETVLDIDDDSGIGDLSSRIRWLCLESGDYGICIDNLESEDGAFDLIVNETDGLQIDGDTFLTLNPQLQMDGEIRAPLVQAGATMIHNEKPGQGGWLCLDVTGRECLPRPIQHRGYSRLFEGWRRDGKGVAV